MAAGALTVVASLWKVDDDSTQSLMRELYARLVAPSSGQLDAARALQGAMRALIAEGRSAVYWAAFVPYGLWSWEPDGETARVAPAQPGPERRQRTVTVVEVLKRAKIPARLVDGYAEKLEAEGYHTLEVGAGQHLHPYPYPYHIRYPYSYPCPYYNP